MSATAQSSPVTACISCTVRAGAIAEYEKWLEEVSALAKGFAGFLSAQVIKACPQTSGEYLLIAGFQSQAQLQAWLESPQLQQKTCELEQQQLVQGESVIKHMASSDFWLALPNSQAMAVKPAKPKNHKMWLLLFVVVFSLLMLINYTFNYWLAPLPLPAKFALMVAGQVFLMTYFVMPLLMRKLGPWLTR